MLVGILFRGPIFRLLVSYKSIGQRTTYVATDQNLINYIEADESFGGRSDIKELIRNALSKTSRKLEFTASKNDNDPNKLIDSKTAHCVGYSSFFATTCNHLLEKNNLNEEWVAQPQIGQLLILEVNVHQYFDSSIFKDHDFVVIQNKVTGEKLAVDPTIHDYLAIDFIQYVE